VRLNEIKQDVQNKTYIAIEFDWFLLQLAENMKIKSTQTKRSNLLHQVQTQNFIQSREIETDKIIFEHKHTNCILKSKYVCNTKLTFYRLLIQILKPDKC
jgi:hypothetical protein